MVIDKKSGSWVKILKRIAYFCYLILKTLWLTVWTVYQIALGAILVGLVWGGHWVGEYFSLWDIRNLTTQNPTSTAFMDSERTHLADSLIAKGMVPKKDSLIKWSWIPFDSIPNVIQEVALIAEDAKFYEHQGFDLEQIEFALVANHQAGKQARGASTITQQVAKNLFLSKDKELSRKLREAFITIAMEQWLTKDRILEIYLNVAQFDNGIFGIREGAKHWLKKDVKNLTQEEAIDLICLLPSPTKWNIKKPNNAYLQHKRLVLRNYAMFKGMKVNADTLVANWRDSVYTNLAEQLADERWKVLRTRPIIDSTPDSAASQSQKTNIRTF